MWQVNGYSMKYFFHISVTGHMRQRFASSDKVLKGMPVYVATHVLDMGQ